MNKPRGATHGISVPIHLSESNDGLICLHLYPYLQLHITQTERHGLGPHPRPSNWAGTNHPSIQRVWTLSQNYLTCTVVISKNIKDPLYIWNVISHVYSYYRVTICNYVEGHYIHCKQSFRLTTCIVTRSIGSPLWICKFHNGSCAR